MAILSQEELEKNEDYLAVYGRAGQKMSLSEGGEPTTDPNAQEEELGVLGKIADPLLAVPRGVLGAAEEILELPQVFGASYEIPDNFGAGKSKTAVGGVVEGITSFGVGFVGALGLVGKAGKVVRVGQAASKPGKAAKTSRAAKIGKYTAAGAIADFAVFDAHEARLADLVQQFPQLENPVTEYLASDMEDSELEGRLKNVIEGAAIGGAIDLLAASVRLIRKSRDLRDKGASPEEVAKATAKEIEEVSAAAAKVDKAEEARLNELAGVPEQAAAKEADEGTVPEAPKAEEDLPPEPPKAPKASAVLKYFAQEAEKGGKSRVAQFLERLKTEDAEKVYEDLQKQFEKDGVLFNLDAFKNANEISQEGNALISGLYETLLKSKEEIFASPEAREKVVQELKDYGYDESADLIKGITDQQQIDAKLWAAQFTLRQGTQQLSDTTKLYETLTEQLSKNPSEVEKAKIFEELSRVELKFAQFEEQNTVLASSIGAVKSQLGKSLVETRWMNHYMDEAGMNDIGRVREQLDNILALRDKSPEELKAALRKTAAVAKEHGAAGVARMGAGKGLLDMHNELWVNSLLSGPRTFLVNTLGNAMAGIYLPLEKALGAQIGYFRTGDARYLTARNQLLKMTFMLDGFNEARKLGIAAYREGDSILEKRTAVTSELRGDAISSENFREQGGVLRGMANYFGTGIDTAGNIVRQPTKILTGTDEFFKQLQFRYMLKAESAIKAHDNLIARAKKELQEKYGDKPIPEKELEAIEFKESEISEETARLMEGVIRENGERYSKKAVIRDAVAELQSKMKDMPPDQQLDVATQQNFISKYVADNFDQSKSDLSERAFSAAREATFTLPQEGAFGQWVQQGVGKMGVLRAIIPFVSTPLNILKFFGQRTAGVGFGIKSEALHKRYTQEIQSSDPMVRAAVEGRMVAGTGLWATAATLAYSGKLTGHGPERESERKLLQETGWRPYSIKAGDTYISYERLDPFATFLGMAADLADYIRNSDQADESVMESALPALLLGVSQNVTNKSYLTGLQQVLDVATNPQRSAASFFRIRAGSYVPAAAGQMAGSLDGDEAIREARTMWESIKKRVPGAGDLDPRRNVLGDVVKHSGRIGPDYISPVVISSRKKDAVMDELAKAQHAFSAPSRKMKGIDLYDFKNKKGQSAYDRWLELQSEVKVGGKTLRQQLTRLIQNKGYQRLSDVPEADFMSPRVKSLKRIISQYRAVAKSKMLSEFPELSEEVGLVDQINFNRARGRDVEGLLDQLKGLR